MEEQVRGHAQHLIGPSLTHTLLVEIALVARLRPGHPARTCSGQPTSSLHFFGVLARVALWRRRNTPGWRVIGLHQTNTHGVPGCGLAIPVAQGEPAINEPDQHQRAATQGQLSLEAAKVTLQPLEQQRAGQQHQHVQALSAHQVNPLYRQHKRRLGFTKAQVKQGRVQRAGDHQRQREADQIKLRQPPRDQTKQHAADGNGCAGIQPEQRGQQQTDRQRQPLQVNDKIDHPVGSADVKHRAAAPAQQRGLTQAAGVQGKQ